MYEELRNIQVQQQKYMSIQSQMCLSIKSQISKKKNVERKKA